MSRVSNLLCKKDCSSSHLKRMSQYFLLLIPGTLVWYKAFGDWEVQYIVCERKTLHTQMMPEEISLMLDHMASMKMDWIDWIDNMNICSSRAKQCPERAMLMAVISVSISDCHRTNDLLRHQLCRDHLHISCSHCKFHKSLIALSFDLHNSMFQTPCGYLINCFAWSKQL